MDRRIAPLLIALPWPFSPSRNPCANPGRQYLSKAVSAPNRRIVPLLDDRSTDQAGILTRNPAEATPAGRGGSSLSLTPQIPRHVTFSNSLVLVGSRRCAPFPSDLQPSMEPDIFTFHELDILTLQRHLLSRA